MKKVLVTGENGYIGQKFKDWIQLNNKEIELDFISVRSETWRDVDFTTYDSILHLAGIAHVSRDPKLKKKYYQVNRDLTIELAEKAKKEKVKQFIFMSSIIVYGSQNYIDDYTIPKPRDFYGESKLQAENGLIDLLEHSTVKLNIIRTPMVYGQNCKGNYSKLSFFARKISIFPSYKNKRSMIYINNLCEYIERIILECEQGIHFPQNIDYISTNEIIKEISKVHGKTYCEVNIFNGLIKNLVSKSVFINKIFGDLYYSKKLSEKINGCNFIDFKRSILETESSKKGVQK